MKIHHTAIYTTDLEGVKDFFTRYFQAEAHPMYHNPTTGLRSYFLSFQEGETKLEIMNRPETKSPSMQMPFTAGLHHLSMSVDTREKVDLLTKQLLANGYSVLDGPRTTGDGFYESCIQGPDGILVEITE